MAAPVLVTCAVGAYTKVATAVTSVRVTPVDGGNYFWTYRLTGVAAPTLITEAIDLHAPASLLPLSFSASSDVYVWNAGQDSGKVRVDA